MSDDNDELGHLRTCAMTLGLSVSQGRRIMQLLDAAMAQVVGLQGELQRARAGRSAMRGTLFEELQGVRAEAEKLRAQLAGCGVAAIDGSAQQEAPPDAYGWSPAYAAVLTLRRRHDTLIRKLTEMSADTTVTTTVGEAVLAAVTFA